MFKAVLDKAGEALPYEKDLTKFFTAVDEADFIPSEAKKAVKNRIESDSHRHWRDKDENGKIIEREEFIGWCHGTPTNYEETTIPKRPIITFESGQQVQLSIFDY